MAGTKGRSGRLDVKNPKDKYVAVRFTAEELRQLDAYRAHAGAKLSRSAAIRVLIVRALGQEVTDTVQEEL